MKAAHDAEVKRNKEAEKKRLADKEKRKTVKQERRGRGNGFMWFSRFILLYNVC